jgi:uncharacterized protein YfeS
MAMEYRFINADSTKVTMDVTLGDIADLRDILTKALDAKLEDVSRWQLRRLIRELAEAQRKTAETLEYEAKALVEKAKLPDDF